LKLIAFSLIFVLIASSLSAWALQVDDVARELICDCGCGKMLNVCEMQSCAGAMKKLIRKKIAAGWSKERIIRYFVRLYGERILAVPTKRGFDLTAWITPFLAMAIGGLAIYLVIIRWVKIRGKGEKKNKPGSKRSGEVESKYEKKLDKELKDFDR
jgi:cytochrome c-type biogenesis protein CcmH